MQVWAQAAVFEKFKVYNLPQPFDFLHKWNVVAISRNEHRSVVIVKKRVHEEVLGK